MKGKLPPVCQEIPSHAVQSLLVAKSTVKEAGFILPLKINQFLTKDHEVVGIDLDNDTKVDKLTRCYSNEGEHLNVWSSRQKSKKLAHAYHYLGMDLVANCKKGDY